MPCLCIWFNCHAQFTDTTQHYVNYTTTGSINKTNDGDAYLLNNGLKFSLRKKKSLLNFNNNWVYGKQNGTLTNNDYSSSLDFNLYKTTRFYYWGLANYNTSYSLKINNQLLAGLGVAYSIIDRKNAYLNLSDGILYDKSDLFLNDTTREVYHTYRNSFRLQFRFNMHDVVILDGSGFLQNSLQYRNDYIIRSNVSLTFKVRKWLGLSTSLNYNRMNRTQSENMLLSYGLTAEKYF
jgi:hypothetical protein